MTNNQFTISVVAAEQVKKQLLERGTPDSYLRLGVKGGGCSGFSYALFFEDSPPKSKDIIFALEGLRVVIDSKSMIYLNGCTLDWEKTLMNHGFKFINPNEISSCGCGLSFSV